MSKKDVQIIQSNFSKFIPQEEEWIIYKEKLDFFFDTNLINDEDRKRNALINYLDTTVYKLLRDLCAPKLPKDKSYVELCVILDKYFTPTVIVFDERKVFFGASINTGESANEYCARLKGLATNCKFQEHLEHNLINKFVTSFDGKVFERLSEEDHTVTLEKALEIAMRVELKYSKVTNLNFLRKGCSALQSSKSHETQSVHQNQQQLSRSRNNNGSTQQKPATPGKTNVRCGRCDRYNHNQEKCIFISMKCFSCGKMGHSSRVCHKFGKNMFYVNEQCDKENRDEISIHNLENFSNNVEMEKVLYNMRSENNDRDKLITIKVEINNIKFNAEVDTGSNFGAMSKSFYENSFYNLKFIEKKLHLKGYDGRSMNVLGCIETNLTYNNKTELLNSIYGY